MRCRWCEAARRDDEHVGEHAGLVGQLGDRTKVQHDAADTVGMAGRLRQAEPVDVGGLPAAGVPGAPAYVRDCSHAVPGVVMKGMARAPVVSLTVTVHDALNTQLTAGALPSTTVRVSPAAAVAAATASPASTPADPRIDRPPAAFARRDCSRKPGYATLARVRR